MNETIPMDVYGTGSPNVHKVLFALEEMNIPHVFHQINIKKGEQYSEKIKKINPNCKVPVIVDHSVPGDIVVFESGNILQYLATRYGNGRYLPSQIKDIKGHTEVMNWLFWQMANLGPIFGQFYHFFFYSVEKHPYSFQRYLNELTRLLYIIEDRLENNEFIVGNEYTVADMAIFPWVRYIPGIPDINSQEFPRIMKYIDIMKTIPSVQKVLFVIEEEHKANPPSLPTDEERAWMFGQDGRKKSSN
ncbi:hypothetical protein PPL_06908 [Heterostelium album PN500]|uniref:Glutathione S-transferase n=1 Tax=Heterostelium pallidum (strain ATCC 26659 / Pp 5 / PN500) TaxID=670386 RepID=D3BDV5_HETP5|nr:hypothetical protein PPL_06908 [Heterostelium album PN500]EFA80086.1 hypothetical protein PPL_06908 [Heterostelium album PN500]|eukprot:XP_020432206.1 hypothetical protein PPL_06908 [Heterostelium album PN500]